MTEAQKEARKAYARNYYRNYYQTHKEAYKAAQKRYKKNRVAKIVLEALRLANVDDQKALTIASMYGADAQKESK